MKLPAHYVRSRTSLGVAADRLLRTRPTFSKSIMVSVAVSKSGCSGLVFVEPGTKVNGAYYRDDYCCQNNCFQLSVTSLEIRLCSNKTAHHLTGLETRSLFWLLKHLSSSVPIVGPRIVRTLTRSTTSFGESCRNGCSLSEAYTGVDIDDLKQWLIAAWSGIHQQVIDQAIDQWREMLRACVKASGHFEHLLWSSFTVLCVHLELSEFFNFSFAFCCVMFMSTVAVRDVFSAWVTIKYHS